VGGLIRTGIFVVAADALYYPAAGNAEDTASIGRAIHLHHQGLCHCVGNLDPGIDVPGNGIDVCHLSHVRDLDYHYGPLPDVNPFPIPGS